MRIVVTGATGLIGSTFVARAAARGDDVVVLSRDRERAQPVLGGGIEVQEWPQPLQAPPPAAALRGADAVVNLLGESVAQRWSPQAKQKIRDSRVRGTEQLVAGIAALEPAQRPGTLISGSAIGFYGPHDGSPVGEREPPGGDFLAQVVVAWEDRARAAAELGLRVVLARTGVVLSTSGGALGQMLPPFRLGVGGPVAGGRQYVSWIHLHDVAGALLHCLDDARLEGPVNLTAPRPVTNAELSRTLGRVLHRPAVLPVPAAALRLLYGEMAMVVTTGQNAPPLRLQETGYAFAFPDLEPALGDLLG